MRKLILYLAVISLIVSVLIVCWSYFRVKVINVEGAKELLGVDEYSSDNMFTLSATRIEQEILDKNPALHTAHVEIEFPQTLNISVIESAPIAKIVLEDGYMSLSSEGKIISKQKNDMDQIQLVVKHYQPLYFRNFVVGEVIDIEEVVKSVYFIEEAQKIGLSISRVDIRNENMIVLNSEEREILVSATKDARKQVAQLKVVIEQFRTKALSFSRLDLRFEKPIVVFNK